MGVFDIEADARRAFDVLKAGGIAIVPNTVGYAITGGSGPALRKIFETKRRAPVKLNAMVGNMAIHREVHDCSARGREIVRVIVEDYGLPLGCIAPCRFDHPLLALHDRETIAASTKTGTLAMLLNAGTLHAALTGLSYAEGHPIFGSSANLSLGGTKFTVEAIEPEIIGIADVVIDHGSQRYHPYRASSTLLDVENLEVVRFGSCYPDIAYVLKRHFGIELPPAPARP